MIIYLVGGTVRDHSLNILATKDYDFADLGYVLRQYFPNLWFKPTTEKR